MNSTAPAAAAFSLAVLLAVFAAAEAGYRTFAGASEDQRLVTAFVERDLRLLEPCARVERGDDGLRLVGRSRVEMRMFDYPLARTPGSLRVAVVGESSGTMLAVAMKELLERSNTEGVEVLNCASPGGSLEHAVRRADEAVAYQPDVLVVVFGHNLEMQYSMNAWRLRLEYWLRQSHLLGRVLTAIAPPGPPRTTDMGARVAALEHWLRDLAKQARERGITVIVETLAANMWVPPFAGREALDDEEFLAARFDYARGARERAIARLGASIERRDEPYWRFVLGTWLARRGDFDRARAHFQAAIDSASIEPDRASSAVNETIRRVADDDTLVLRDTERAVAALARHGIPGWDVMRDHCHLKPHLFEADARETLLLARRAVGPDTPLDLAVSLQAWPSRLDMQRVLDGITAAQVQSGGEFARRWAHATTYALEQWIELGYESVDETIDEYLDGPIFARITKAEHRACMLAAIAEGYWVAGREERARAVADRAAAAPSAEARTELALLEIAQGRPELARNLLGGALELETARVDARFYLRRLGTQAGAAQ